jgi:hypothetical protein
MYKLKNVKWEKREGYDQWGYCYADTGVGMSISKIHGRYYGHCSYNRMREYTPDNRGHETLADAKRWCMEQVEAWLKKHFLTKAKT